MSRVIHWFRNDLRIHDNPALYAAAEASGGEVLACFIVSREQWAEHDWGDVRNRWLLRNLQALREALQELGIPLLILESDRFSGHLAALQKVLHQSGAQALFLNEEYAINERRRDREICRSLESDGIRVQRYRDQSIAAVGSVRTAEDKAYSVFSPFKWRWWQHFQDSWQNPLPAPKKQRELKLEGELQDLARLRIDESMFDENSADIVAHYAPGEEAAHERLVNFVAERAGDYHDDRNLPAVDGTSRLSPYLALGVLSGRQCLHEAQTRRREHARERAGLDGWINELIWRDFYIHVLHQFPHVSRHRAFRPEFEAVPWEWEGEHFNAWCRGETGVPIVDAAMRQLNQTGWMHNRLRMIVAMFLTKNLNVHWRLGEQYFMQKLIDGYLPANNGGWQWSASTGTDAAPYFRIFNPVSQGSKFDPDCVFLDQYVPELARIPLKKRHNPLLEPVSGVDYPSAIVDVKASRQAAIERFKAVQKKASETA